MYKSEKQYIELPYFIMHVNVDKKLNVFQIENTRTSVKEH